MLRLTLITLSLAIGAAAPTPTTRVPHELTIKRVAKVFIAADKPAYSISYEYDFRGKTRVHIAGLGFVRSRGSFSYLTRTPRLVISDENQNRVLADVPLTETVVIAAKPPLNEVPDEHQFPRALRSFRWDRDEPIQAHADEVLSKYFRYSPQENNNVVTLTTTFAPIPLPANNSGLTGQVALSLSFPARPEVGGSILLARSIVREGRSHSDEYRVTGNLALTKAADAFIDALIAEMKAGTNP
jgi:hypothetical protein